ncbi:enhanced level of genomic instability 1 isoform X1 [Drosophila tropicalis]|uniref:enhanced level of genomic instability 1 isoform X1 n=2 Tax=Drosophila tropicalis TaxID=46794 RepID=UPI0035AB7EEA
MPRAAQIPVKKMTDADVNCFASELSSPSSSSASPRTPTKNVQLELEPTSPFVLRAPASAKSKLILQNMEEVLNTVKQKHREKHKRKREEKRRAAAEAAAAAAAASSSPSMDEKTKSEKPQPLREKATQENGLSSSHSKSLLKKPNESASAGSTPTANPPIPSKPTNVFELMMKARNRSLGVNEGAAKELPLNDSECNEAAASPTLGKRKQLLQEWNDRKGGAKRRLADEQRGEFIGQQLEKRAKRFKKMLTQESPTAIVNVTASAPTLPIAKRGRGRPRRRRLSSVDTEMQKEQEPEQSPIPSTDTQTAEFLAKLSSPTKKRDSLLGYFAKVETPKNVPLNQAAASLETPPQETPKRRPRRTNNNKLEHEPESSVVPHSEPAIALPNISTPSGRPRRSCANKARYDYDLETSPIKSNPVAKEDNSIEIIDLDTSNPPTTPKKLAPLFVKQLPKPSPDPSVLKARQDFLHSGVPERIRQEQSRLKQLEQQYDENYEVFPRVAHVGCLDYKTLVINLPKPWSWRQEQKDHDDQYDGNSLHSHARLCDPPQHPATNQKQRPSYATLPSLDNKRSFVKLWKNEFDRFPTFKCYNQMREKYRHFSAMDSAQDTQQVGESFVVTRRSRRSLEQQQQQKQLQQQQQQLDNMDEVKPPMGAPNGELLFTEKYKPLLFEQVLVNLTPVQELKEFLSSWCTAGGNNGGRKNSQDDFNYDTMDSSSCSMTSNSNSNTMVLVGPSSSGKTNAVFALANDLNFNVLEINAGMRRTGKKLMQELQEATQSHQIRKDNKSARGKGNSGNLLQKMQKSSISNESSASNAASASSAAAADVRKSLILIEDADIVFEQHDAGFTDAIYTLANSSKRPVIVVATNPNCPHLQRLMQQNCIHFHAPNALNISRFLAVLSLMENCPIELDELVSLYLYNAQNLRKTLMELQFYIQSGGDPKDSKALIKTHNGKTKSPIKSPKLSTIDGSYIHQRLFEFYTCTQNIPNRIPFPLDFHLLRLNLGDLLKSSSALEPPSSSSAAATAAASAGETNRVKRKSRSPKKAWLINSVNQKKQLITPLDRLASFYENISIASQINAHADHTDRLQSHLSEDISHLLVEQALLTGLAIKDDCPYNLFDKPTQRSTLCDQLGSYQLRTATARSLDYEPTLRSICRSERERSTQERRSSRFYHYLRNHLVNVTSFSMESCEAVCQVLQSTPSNSSIQNSTLSTETQSTNNS